MNKFDLVITLINQKPDFYAISRPRDFEEGCVTDLLDARGNTIETLGFLSALDAFIVRKITMIRSKEEWIRYLRTLLISDTNTLELAKQFWDNALEYGVLFPTQVGYCTVNTMTSLKTALSEKAGSLFGGMKKNSKKYQEDTEALDKELSSLKASVREQINGFFAARSITNSDFFCTKANTNLETEVKLDPDQEMIKYILDSGFNENALNNYIKTLGMDVVREVYTRCKANITSEDGFGRYFNTALSKERQKMTEDTTSVKPAIEEVAEQRQEVQEPPKREENTQGFKIMNEDEIHYQKYLKTFSESFNGAFNYRPLDKSSFLSLLKVFGGTIDQLCFTLEEIGKELREKSTICGESGFSASAKNKLESGLLLKTWYKKLTDTGWSEALSGTVFSQPEEQPKQVQLQCEATSVEQAQVENRLELAPNYSPFMQANPEINWDMVNSLFEHDDEDVQTDFNDGYAVGAL